MIEAVECPLCQDELLSALPKIPVLLCAQCRVDSRFEERHDLENDQVMMVLMLRNQDWKEGAPYYSKEWIIGYREMEGRRLP